MNKKNEVSHIIYKYWTKKIIFNTNIYDDYESDVAKIW